MNPIVDRQNQEKYLKIQYSARTCYNFAETLSIFAWVLVVINICVDMLIQDDEHIKVYLVASCAILVFIIQEVVSKITQFAAAFRMYFDYEMFGWTSNLYHNVSGRELCEKSELIVRLRKKDSEIRMKNNGEQKPRGVRKWYSDIEAIPDGKKLINECQQQNMWWNNKISSIQNIIFICILLALMVLILIKYYHAEVSDLLVFLLSVVTLFINLFTEGKRNKRHKELVQKFEHHNKCINNHNDITMDDLKELQELIDERRNVPTITLNIVHDRGATLLHKIYRSKN